MFLRQNDQGILLICTAVRDEDVLREYFDHYIDFHRSKHGNKVPRISIPIKKFVPHSLRPSNLFKKEKESRTPPLVKVTNVDEKELPDLPNGKKTHNDEEDQEHVENSEVDEVILVRKLSPLQSLRQRRDGVLRELEVVCTTSPSKADGRHTSSSRSASWPQCLSTRSTSPNRSANTVRRREKPVWSRRVQSWPTSPRLAS